MPATATWIIENELMLNKLEGVVTIEELGQVLADEIAMMSQSSRYHVHLIADGREVTDLGSVQQALGMNQSNDFQFPEQLGWLVVIDSPNPMVNFVGDLMSQAGGSRYRHVKSMAAAIELLRDLDPDLSWDKLPESYQHRTD